ncbi:uncharacterized protein EURHEDRAFT_417432 [Aspergillus ruber CBS 135680]|uniref:Uncharacterized protein n=1 Tax=Aspergillus ruber (strain CBS 135680) TaxID=1388766 RepID=A0A017S1F6_ASPRC|nr:uncharacterized protein EURHEDRAFT_417432 [Aspergillus ruber CBS 135680]EYE90459.1 hypothetical protein EURHEDRAFT_417432 [Aspergillus ruber CBS 135680]
MMGLCMPIPEYSIPNPETWIKSRRCSWSLALSWFGLLERTSIINIEIPVYGVAWLRCWSIEHSSSLVWSGLVLGSAWFATWRMYVFIVSSTSEQESERKRKRKRKRKRSRSVYATFEEIAH